jgi:flagellar secretion chaperone FliS
MANGYGANQYKQTKVMTASRGQILLMLYEAAIQNVKKATAATEKQDYATKGVAIGKAHDIINELLNTLNFEVGGEIARNLERLYNYMTEQLVKANMERSADAANKSLQTVQKLMETLLEGWRGAVQQDAPKR